MSNITITVEFMAGTSIQDACQEAKEKAVQWNVSAVDFKFNGINFTVFQDANVENLVDKFLSGIYHGKGDYKFIVG